jgi:CBS-domain-containing membrane protein
MATPTPTKRQATAGKATATRKRNAASKSAARAKASARRPTSAARTTSGSSQATVKKATRTAGRRVDTATARLEAFARQAEWVALIPVGLALEARDLMIGVARTYSDPRRAKRRLDRFERRGATALRRNRRTLEHKARVTRRDMAQRTNGWRSDAENLVEEVRSII